MNFLFVGEEVEWVQCDKCENWYHVICVGISSEEAATIDEYLCPDCNPPPIIKKVKLEEPTQQPPTPIELKIPPTSSLDDLSVMAHVATQMMAAQPTTQPRLKTDNENNHNNNLIINSTNSSCHNMDLNSLQCLADISEKMDTAHVQSDISNVETRGSGGGVVQMECDVKTSSDTTSNNTSNNTSNGCLNKELCDPVVPTDGTVEDHPPLV